MGSYTLLLDILIAVVSVGLVLCAIRLLLGPNVPNRTVAFDVIAIHAVCLVVLFSVRIDSPFLLDVAIVTAVLGFLGTVMLARYLESADVVEQVSASESPDSSPTDSGAGGNGGL
ncbi:MAG: cation transporter [Caldilineaceae bacterium]|nr:cation transporter [Caldilineaceae bacterium]